MNGGFAMTEAHCLTQMSGEKSVPAHLTLLRDALARGQGKNAQACAAGRAARGHASSRRGPGRTGPTMQITLAQWVSRTTSCTR
ncbi:hypothetical protein ACH4CE_29795 [Streptomyces gelaticus]|uniref:hypothetical protein n=1 Tax=Streptomyces gelaticus TaxID=285446 RepID=UPI0037AE4ED4